MPFSVTHNSVFVFVSHFTGLLNFVSGHMMADKYVVAVDESKFAEDAFECESSHVFIRIGSHNEQNEPINVKR